jgi:polar amino acid transport system substrate-binding protein
MHDDEQSAISRRHLGAALLVASAAGAVAAGPAAAQQPAESAFDRIQRTKVLRCGVVAAGAPYYTKDIVTGEWKGFYYELYRRMCDDLKLEMELHEIDWGSGVLELQSNKIDIFFGLTPTPQRALAIDFSDVAIRTFACVIAKPGLKVETWTDLDKPETRVSVDVGSSHDLTATTNLPKASIARFKSVSEATLGLLSGKVDVQVCSIFLALAIKQKNKNIGDVFYPTPYTFGQSSAGLRREPDKTLQTVVNLSLRYYESFGFIRNAVIRNLALVGLSEADIPADIHL